jgi:NAD(P)-dependent dehydrogenase (short-subunit alcohol dehydrogenase family)
MTVHEGTVLEGKVAVVTGAGSGIGRACALRMAAAGAAIVVNDLDPEAAQAVVSRIASAGGRASALAADVTQPDTADALVAHAVEHFGSLSIFHTNAGGAMPTSTDQTSDSLYREIMQLNLDAVWLGAQAALRSMLPAGGGTILATSSGAGVGAAYGLAAYGAAKAGVIQLVRSLAVEYGSRGIRANAVVPGAIETPGLLAWLDTLPGGHARFAGQIPQGRLGRAADIAEAVTFLASDAASYINGVALPVDGGTVAKLASPSPG